MVFYKKKMESKHRFQHKIKDEKGGFFDFEILLKDEQIMMKLCQELSSAYWEVAFNLESLKGENKNWFFFDDNMDLYDYITIAIKENDFVFENTFEDKNLTFIIKKKICNHTQK